IEDRPGDRRACPGSNRNDAAFKGRAPAQRHAHPLATRGTDASVVDLEVLGSQSGGTDRAAATRQKTVELCPVQLQLRTGTRSCGRRLRERPRLRRRLRGRGVLERMTAMVAAFDPCEIRLPAVRTRHAGPPWWCFLAPLASDAIPEHPSMDEFFCN